MEHEKYILRAIELAENGSGFVSPNPKVGAVIVRNDKIIAEGWHTKFGMPHAEVEAIKNAGDIDFSDCTIYVNLEPCAHFGKTPPCTDLIIEKKFSKVVVGCTDPNPIVAGKGIEKLRAAGIEVITNICMKESEWCNRVFIKNITTQKPYIILKIGQTLDGCIALKNGQSKWITSEESRLRTHKLRSGLDAVLVGKNTVIKDNPLLTVRSVSGRNPMRVICDSNLSLPLDLSVFKLEDNAMTIICCSEEASKSRKARNLGLSGIKILTVKTGEDGRLELSNAVESLKKSFGISSILVEGGSILFSSFIKQHLADELQIFIAPKIFGNCKNSFEFIDLKSISDAYEFELISFDQSGGDIHAIYTKK
ncbi:MAG: bifunctional diaminohydroxyphosphoribosylaminopyrimidine deaminase/5-amino-6-(5-phosphoribosylamino)uracil reductase RibD [Candidatus Kapabacteria bacterium]|nr:bifunctional diaminohydroxyphosphoribosylaminopyrimidine deaminase/5-amino-6-(5-phosphoribosylamino)uracil reductase RibD [Ignavibacteriota bacterium]MCW5884429.1 bifunctional diaminohydroxyphosphoribosylaminopyrimidine deaminase/5-amino-6-(5-phosphoribosylamino)uracil reductase RibD [Candidatus Kapabacteria bacterium]